MLERYTKVANFLKLLDIVFTCLAFYCAFLIKVNPIFPVGELSTVPNYSIVLLLVIIIWHISLSIFKPYDFGRKGLNFRLSYDLWRAVTAGIVVLILCLFLFKIKHFSRLLLAIFYVLDLIFLLLSRLAVHQILFANKNKAYFRRHVLILGSRSTAREVIHAIARNRESGINIIGCIETHPDRVGQNVTDRVQIIGTIQELPELLKKEVVDEILITMPLNQIENSEWYLSYINTYGITTRIIPQWYIRKFFASRPRFYAMQSEDFLTEPALILSTSAQKNEELLLKRICDYTVAILGMLMTAPLFPLFAVAIKIASPGPVFYRQNRSGLYGRTFDVLKFRTMVPNAEEILPDLLHLNEATGAVFKMKADPRIIPLVGHFLRKTSLDELPQLINVLKGEMSIVGPRPPIPAEVERYELWQRRRLAMRPGITCIWQVQRNRNDISFDQWMDMDLEYIDNWSIWLDLKIIWWTIPAVLFGRGR